MSSEIPTPFIGTGEDFKKEFDKMAHKYGIPEYLLVFREDYDEKTDEYHWFHSELHEYFMDYLEDKFEDMREQFNHE